MAFLAWGKFTVSNPAPVGATAAKSDMFKGQQDLNVDTSKNHPPSEWFKVIRWAEEQMAPVDFTAGQAGGNVKLARVRIMKYFGRLSPLCMDALVNRAYFNLTIHLVDRSGDTAKMSASIIYSTCQLARVRHFVGDAHTSSSSTSHTQNADTTELEELEVVHQQIDKVWDNRGKKTIGGWKLSDIQG